LGGIGPIPRGVPGLRHEWTRRGFDRDVRRSAWTWREPRVPREVPDDRKAWSGLRPTLHESLIPRQITHALKDRSYNEHPHPPPRTGRVTAGASALHTTNGGTSRSQLGGSAPRISRLTSRFIEVPPRFMLECGCVSVRRRISSAPPGQDGVGRLVPRVSLRPPVGGLRFTRGYILEPLRGSGGGQCLAPLRG
jgi:hypothetical protein